jgi:hypothetical protein
MKTKKTKVKKCIVCGKKMILICPNEWTKRDEEAYQKGYAVGKSESESDEYPNEYK